MQFLFLPSLLLLASPTSFSLLLFCFPSLFDFHCFSFLFLYSCFALSALYLYLGFIDLISFTYFLLLYNSAVPCTFSSHHYQSLLEFLQKAHLLKLLVYFVKSPTLICILGKTELGFLVSQVMFNSCKLG